MLSGEIPLNEAVKPSKRIVLRKLTLNFRIIATITVIVLQFLNQFVSAFTNQTSVYDFLVDLADSTNIFIIGATVLLILFFFYLVTLLLTNIGTIIWGYLNYLTMDNYLDESTINIKKGIIFRKEFEIQLNKLTNVQIEISIIDRILRTADLHCSTAGGADIYVLETLTQENARAIQQYLLRHIGSLGTSFDNIPASFLADPRIQEELHQIHQLLVEAFPRS